MFQSFFIIYGLSCCVNVWLLSGAGRKFLNEHPVHVLGTVVMLGPLFCFPATMVLIVSSIRGWMREVFCWYALRKLRKELEKLHQHLVDSSNQGEVTVEDIAKMERMLNGIVTRVEDLVEETE